MRRLVVVAGTAVLPAGALAALAVAGPVAADEDSFIDYMRSHGQWVQPSSEGNWIAGGFQICDRIRAAGPEAGMKLVSPMAGRDPATYVYAAQHELCPDTLAPGQ